MLDIRRAVIEDIRVSIVPVRVDVERPSTVVVPSSWVRPPGTSSGRVRALPKFKSGTLVMDIWHKTSAELDDVYAALGWMNGHSPPSFGDAMAIRYEETGWVVLREPTAYHGTITWDVEFFDARGMR